MSKNLEILLRNLEFWLLLKKNLTLGSSLRRIIGRKLLEAASLNRTLFMLLFSSFVHFSYQLSLDTYLSL